MIWDAPSASRDLTRLSYRVPNMDILLFFDDWNLTVCRPGLEEPLRAQIIAGSGGVVGLSAQGERLTWGLPGGAAS